MKRFIRILTLVMCMALVMSFSSTAFATPGVLPDEIGLIQQTSVTCTLASAAMMMRARMYRSDNTLWSSITESSIQPVAWNNGVGLRGSWTYEIGGNSISVSCSSCNGMSASWLKTYLDQHPEGIVIYDTSLPHAVFVCDYVGDTFYCFDSNSHPSVAYSGRQALTTYYMRQLGSQTDILNAIDKYWYVSSYSIQPSQGTLDLNGLLDGEQIGGLSDYGTCDVYINGSLAPERTNTTDYVDDTLPANTTYLITNIKANEGFSYDGLAPGSADLSGTIQAGVRTDVRLKFNSCTLTVNGLLDGTASDNLGNYGTFDLYVNGTQVKNDINAYSGRLAKGATYEIKDIKANTGFAYKSASGSLTGKIKSGNTTVRLGFDAIGTISEDWITVDRLPGNINSTICDIEYKHTYQTTAQSSPGVGWSQVPGSGNTTYVNDGNVWETEFAQQTSATCELVGSYYYHYCGTGYGIEHFEDVANGYTTLHVAGLTNGNFEVVATQKDSCHDILQYELKHTAAPWEGQAALCNDGRSDWWYIKYQYQSKKAVTTYDWTKTTDWTSTKDSTASSVQYRYRLKSSLTKLALPANLTKIEDEAFAGTVMNAVIVPDSCTTIGSKAFANCSELVFVSVPKGTTIATDAFEGCGSVTVNER